MFGVLSFLLIKAFAEQNTVAFLNANPKITSIIFSCLYGILVEVLQEYCFIGRQGDKFDAMADALGALLGLWFYNYWINRNKPQKA